MKKINNWWLPDSDNYFSAHLDKGKDGIQLEHLQKAMEFVDDFTLAIDVGAHVGTYCVPMSKRFQSVMALEADLDNYFCLVANIASRKIDNVMPLWAAACECSGDNLVVQEDAGRIGNSGAHFVAKGGVEKAIRPATLRVDDFVKDKAITFAKIDVEGFEKMVLDGLYNALAPNALIMIEHKDFPNRYNFGVGDAQRSLAQKGYKCVGQANNDWFYKR